VIRVEVLGEPKTKGSLRPMKTKAGHPFVVEQMGEALRTWRERLSAALQSAAEGLDGPLEGPFAVFAHFRFAPPKKRTWAWPIAKGRRDLDKLERTILDHLSGVIVVDDAQVALLVSTKVFGTPGATIVIEEITHDSRVDLGTLMLEASNVLLGGDRQVVTAR
jgi:Holliday junction resolvase RusA-like endonuclease